MQQHAVLLKAALRYARRMPLKHYKWVYDLRGLDTKEAVEAATGLTLPVRILTDEVSGCVFPGGCMLPWLSS